mmetsp:Transcript_3538/g.9506  ORF Transcript_3538/g.9506 Transcript_3538/m.9506 type:complete len:251 (+) Transcript_3538:362-1114(+)
MAATCGGSACCWLPNSEAHWFAAAGCSTTLLSSNINSPRLILLTNCRNWLLRILGLASWDSTSARARVLRSASALLTLRACAALLACAVLSSFAHASPGLRCAAKLSAHACPGGWCCRAKLSAHACPGIIAGSRCCCCMAKSSAQVCAGPPLAACLAVNSLAQPVDSGRPSLAAAACPVPPQIWSQFSAAVLAPAATSAPMGPTGPCWLCAHASCHLASCTCAMSAGSSDGLMWREASRLLTCWSAKASP